MTKLMWLSFANSSLPKGSQFLGVAIVRASHITEAIKVSHALDINPGGEVQSMGIDESVEIADKWIEKLLTREEVKEFEKELMLKVRES